MRISVLLGFLAALLPLAARSAAPVQDQAHFEQAILDNSTAPYYLLVTIVDDRSGQSRTGCVATPFLLGAIHLELNLPYDSASIDRGVQIALSNSARVYHFSNPKALANVALQYGQSDLDRVRELVRVKGIDGAMSTLRAEDPISRDRRFSTALACVLIENGFAARRGDIPSYIFAEP